MCAKYAFALFQSWCVKSVWMKSGESNLKKQKKQQLKSKCSDDRFIAVNVNVDAICLAF